MKDESSLYWIWLSERCGIASKDFGRLAARYDEPFELYRMESEEIERLDGISGALKERLCDKSLESAYAILKYCRASGVDIIAYTDARYPSRLRTIEDPPVLLYCMGKLPDMNSRLCIGMVGTRKMSDYGMQTAYSIAYELASANAVIVSGMALGVDAVCACGALEAKGETVAVLGCGISVTYPKEHERLKSAIVRRGAVVTEYPPNEPPQARNFPKRNRIISGLSQGVVVVEGSLSSGSLITAARAVDQGRELFALPGKVNESNSEGPNKLIREGANVVLRSDDIIHYYDFLYRDAVSYRGLANAKKSSVLTERTLARYGISRVSYRGRYNVPEPSEPAEEKASDVNKPREKAAKRIEKKEEARIQEPDRSQEVLSSLDATSRRVFELMPLDKAVTADELSAQGVSIGDAVTAFTMLELAGLVTSLPGGMYIRK